MTEKDIIKLAMEYGFTGGFDAQGNLTFDATFVEAVTEAVAKERNEILDSFSPEEPIENWIDKILARGEAQ